MAKNESKLAPFGVLVMPDAKLCAVLFKGKLATLYFESRKMVFDVVDRANGGDVDSIKMLEGLAYHTFDALERKLSLGPNQAFFTKIK